MSYVIEKILWPTGAADSVAPAYAAAIAVQITNRMTVLQLNLTGDATLNLTIDAGVDPGSMILIEATSDATARTLTFGTGIDGAALAGTISKTKSQLFMFDGTVFVPAGAAVQVN